MKQLLQYLFLGLLLFALPQAQAQTLGEFNPNTKKYGMGKLKKNHTRVYIAKFNINYELFKSSKTYKAGGQMMGGGVRGDAEAEVAVGLQGIEEADLIATSTQLYQGFVAQLEAAGYSIVSAKEAAKTKAYESWMLKSGGQVNRSQYPGVATVSPEGYD